MVRRILLFIAIGTLLGALGLAGWRVSVIIADKRSQIERLESSLREKSAELSQFQQDIEKLSALARARFDLEAKLTRLERELAGTKEKEAGLSSQIERLAAEKNKLEEALAQTTRAIQEKEQKMQQAREESKKELELTAAGHLAREEALHTQIEGLKQAFSDLEEEKAALEGNIMEVKAALRKEQAKFEHNKRGLFFEYEKNYQDAISEYQRVLSIDSGDAHAHLRLANIYSAAVKDPQRADYYIERYFTLSWQEHPQTGGVEQLAEELRKEAALKKRTFEQHYNLALNYDSLGRYQEAVREYEKALELAPNDADIHYNLGIVYDDHIKDKKKAIMHYQRYLELCPASEDAEKVKGWIANAKEEWEWEQKLR